MSQSEPITDEPAVQNGPSSDAADAPAPPAETPAPTSDGDNSSESALDKIRRRVRSTRVDPEAERMRTLEDRLMKLEELLTAKVTAPPPAEEEPPVAEIAPPVAPIVPEAPVAQVVSAPVASVVPPPAAKSTWSRGWRSWFLMESLSQAFNSFRLFLRMYVDPRYKMTWLGRLVPLAFVIFFVCSDLDWSISNFIFFWNLIPIVGPMINKLILIAFAWVTVKVLGREMRRYQQTVPDVPEAIRWTNS